jgi:hypothetical protein
MTMNQENSSTPSGLAWFIGGLIFLLALTVLWVGFFKGPQIARPSSGLQVATIGIAGGAEIPDDAPLAEVIAPNTLNAGPIALAPEQPVVVAGAAASGGLRVHADARRDAPVLEVYSDGTELTILDPSGDYTTYPVQNEGAAWYRVRDQNGLVSWAEGEFLSPVGQ